MISLYHNIIYQLSRLKTPEWFVICMFMVGVAYSLSAVYTLVKLMWTGRAK